MDGIGTSLTQQARDFAWLKELQSGVEAAALLAHSTRWWLFWRVGRLLDFD